MTFHAFLATTILACLAVSGCRLGTRSGSRVQHDVGSYIHENSRWNWTAVTSEAYRRYVIPGGASRGVPEEAFLSEGDPLAQRLQFWVDRIDTIVRARDGERARNAPRPIARVIARPTVNAAVSPVVLCSPLTVRSEDLRAPSLVSTAPSYFNRTRGVFGWEAEAADCMPNDWTREEHLQALEWALKPYPECRYRLEGDTIVLPPGSPCLSPSSVLPASTRYGHLTSSNALTIYAGMLRSLGEEEMVTVLAHELAHYYLAHLTTPEKNYGQLYTLGAENPSTRPAHEPALESLYARLRESLRHPPQRVYSVDGAPYHGVLYSQIGKVAISTAGASCATKGPCAHPCAPLRDFFQNASKQRLIRLFPFGRLPDDARPVFDEFTRLAPSCLAAISVGEKISANTYPVTETRRWLGETFSWAKDASADFHVEKWDVFGREVSRRFVIAHDQMMVGYRAVFQEAIDRRLAEYTTEQEADEVGAEFIHRLGLSIGAQVAAEFKLMRANPNPDPALGEVGYEECVALWKNGWKDARGLPAYVPIADWKIHHSPCYRAFLVDREARAHRYVDTFEGRRDLLSEARWSELVTSILWRETPPAPPAQMPPARPSWEF